jgi:hypothetical protein
MVTRGDVSLDVEDNRSPFDWPLIEDVVLDNVQYSVHFPLVPQTGVWPDGQARRIAGQMPAASPQLERVLNIVVPESRVLASRERCPFLVHMEIAETNLEGSDARLYAAGATNLGSTVEEALGMSTAAGAAAAANFPSLKKSSYVIPPELLPLEERGGKRFTRGGGGWQSESQMLDDDQLGGFSYPDPYGVVRDVREEEIQQLYNQMHIQQSLPPPPPPPMTVER